MDPVTYQVVYDLRHQLPNGWWGPALPLAMVFVLVRFAKAGNSSAALVIKGVLVVFAIFLSLFIAVGTTLQYRWLRHALERDDVHWSEGTVAEFVPQKAYDKRPEHFVVVSPEGRYEYSYSSYLDRGGYNGSSFGREPIRNGTRVRIADVDGVIVSLQVAR